MHQGGCFCGAIRYLVTATPFNSTLCHCTMCRRAAGAPAVAWFSVPKTGLRYTAGTPACYASSPGVLRRFCAACGTQLTFEDARWPDEIDITTASLDDPELIPPGYHSFMQSHVRWLQLADTLPRYVRTRAEGAVQLP
ncbi:GFA family protein [Pseudoduganella buxea]|uniref:Aldehyde-activating protein n=1 Tax=Pseudoduganella buxea TaxID=1949069 RepID=A0A6I3T182_9BURK|nr:GFA family protein [Pseudoduganella buxea]MTV54242.1 GFA family protein [Pseudoduganella buxea]GGB82804.1 aldehyde-activating protein [Pseudoduganella buxea]